MSDSSELPDRSAATSNADAGVARVQRLMESGAPTGEVFDLLLKEVLALTQSEYGFIGEILHEQNVPYLKTHAITNIAWSRETREFYRENVRAGLEFRNLDTLFGVTIRSGQMVIANDPANDPRRGGSTWCRIGSR